VPVPDGATADLQPEYAKTVRLLDLEGHSPEDTARMLGITCNNLKVRLHRGRKQLRQRVEQTCQACATHGCLNCTCDTQN
jgi:DNA-directed RNA polymerase specialized sigma24 family protein